MNKRVWLGLLGVCLLVFALMAFWPGRKTADPAAAPSPMGVPETLPSVTEPPPERGPSGTLPGSNVPAGSPGGSTVPPAPSAAMASATPGIVKLAPGDNRPIPEQLEVVRLALRDYRTVAGENPEGSNAEIVRALRGANKKGAKFLGPNAVLNGAGELIDPWGHPYFFHQLSALEMEVRSAGADGQLWTGDDQVTK